MTDKKKDLEAFLTEEAEYAEAHADEDYEIPEGTKVTRGHEQRHALVQKILEEDRGLLGRLAAYDAGETDRESDA